MKRHPHHLRCTHTNAQCAVCRITGCSRRPPSGTLSAAPSQPTRAPCLGLPRSRSPLSASAPAAPAPSALSPGGGGGRAVGEWVGGRGTFGDLTRLCVCRAEQGDEYQGWRGSAAAHTHAPRRRAAPPSPSPRTTAAGRRPPPPLAGPAAAAGRRAASPPAAAAAVGRHCWGPRRRRRFLHGGGTWVGGCRGTRGRGWRRRQQQRHCLLPSIPPIRTLGSHLEDWAARETTGSGAGLK